MLYLSLSALHATGLALLLEAFVNQTNAEPVHMAGNVQPNRNLRMKMFFCSPDCQCWHACDTSLHGRNRFPGPVALLHCAEGKADDAVFIFTRYVPALQTRIYCAILMLSHACLHAIQALVMHAGALGCTEHE